MLEKLVKAPKICKFMLFYEKYVRKKLYLFSLVFNNNQKYCEYSYRKSTKGKNVKKKMKIAALITSINETRRK